MKKKKRKVIESREKNSYLRFTSMTENFILMFIMKSEILLNY